jgi:hypothetical protein
MQNQDLDTANQPSKEKVMDIIQNKQEASVDTTGQQPSRAPAIESELHAMAAENAAKESLDQQPKTAHISFIAIIMVGIAVIVALFLSGLALFIYSS